MAAQPQLGLLPDRRNRTGSRNRIDSSPYGPDLAQTYFTKITGFEANIPLAHTNQEC